MSYKIQSEYQYYLEVTQELEEKLLSRVHEFISAHFSSSSSKGGINNLPPNENEALAKLFEKCHQLSSRVSRAISRTEEEVLEEWNAIHHLLEGDGSSFSSPVVQASSPTTAPPPYVPSTKNKKVAEKGLLELPEKLIDLAELKYQLLQCDTALKHSSSAPTSSATIVKSTVSSGKEYFEEHFPEFLGQCATAVGAGLREAMLNGSDQTSSLEKFKTEASAVDVTSDVKMTVFHSLLGETLKNFLTKLDQRRRVLRRASSSSSLLNSTNTSVHSSPTTVPSATINNTSSSSTQQQQKPNFSHSTPTTIQQQTETQSEKKHQQHQPQQNQIQNQQNQQHHLYSSAFLPPYHSSMSEDQVKDILTNFYTVHAPDFLASVPYLVHEHRDNLGALFEMVAAKYSSNTTENNNNNQQQQQQQQQMGLRQVSSQPQLSQEEVEMAKPSAEADRTLDEDEEEYDQQTRNQNTSSSSPSKVEVVAVRVDERSHQRVQSPLNNNQQQQQQQQQQSAYAGASAADSNEGNCVLQ